MLITIVLWVYFAFLFLAYGAGTVAFLNDLPTLQRRTPLSFSLLAFIGLSVITWISSALSLILQSGLVVHLFLLAGACLLALYNRSQVKTSLLLEFRQRHWTVWLITLLGVITTLFYAVKAPSNADTPLYHAQAIHWIENYPAVPGLGNLDPRLGSNSNWFVLNAAFSFSFLKLQSFHLIPSFLFLTCFFFFSGGLQSILNGDIRLSQIARAGFIPFAFYLLVDEISSPGTDLPVILIYWVIVCLWLESMEQVDSQRELQIIVFLLAVLAITFKVSGVAVLLFAWWIWAGLLRRGEYPTMWLCTGIAAAILIPWLIRNFILTGYWLYPEPLMASFSPDVDWKVPVSRVLSFQRAIQAWALFPGTRWGSVAELSFIQRLAFWFVHLTLNQKGLMVLALIGPILFAGFFFASKHNEAERRFYLSTILVVYLNLLFWLFTAPNLRFGYGFIAGAIVVSYAPFIRKGMETLHQFHFYIALLLILVLSIQQVYVILGSARDGTRYLDYLLVPAAYPRVLTDACKLGPTTISCARNWRQCGYDAFPCVPQALQNVEMRGDTFRAGFRKRTTNEN